MKKRIVAFLLVFVVISMFVGFSYVNAQDGSDGLTEPTPARLSGLPGPIADLNGGIVPDRPRVYSEPSADNREPLVAAAEPEINVWYGDQQKFGNIGNPQQWVNIVGNVAGLGNSGTLKYSLNGKPDQDLSVGPNDGRLDDKGDFNIEIDYDDLNPNNTIVIKASDGVSETQQAVTVNYTAGNTWPSDYTAAWNSSADIQNIAQVVDGDWRIDGNSVVIDSDTWGFDRLLAIGDETWTDYEVTVPITVYGLYPAGNQKFGSGVGFILRWQGHKNIGGEQPSADWSQSGALGWYLWTSSATEALEIRNNENKTIGINYNQVMDFGTTYMFKMSVQSVDGALAYYRLKFWEQGTKEPLDWAIKGETSGTAAESGSLLLVAHNVDARFGEVTVTDLEKLRLNVDVTVDGEGTYLLDPDQDDFTYSQRVLVYAYPEPGHDFAGWTGDYVGVGNPANFLIHKDMALTAHFEPKPPTKLTVNVDGQGSVTKNPNKSEYLWGEEVELTAVPAGDQIFLEWIGDVAGIQNPTTITMDEDKEVTAVFGDKRDATPRSDDFSQCILNSNLWTVVNPAGDASIEMTGMQAKFMIPAGTRHNMWADNSDALRIMQPTEDKNFEIVAKFDSLPNKKYQMEGILIQQDADNWMRFDLFHDGVELRINAGRKVGTSFNSLRTLATNPGASTDAYLKIERNANIWTLSHSFTGEDGDWSILVRPNIAMQVTSTGVFVGNSAQAAGEEPAFNGLVDYFFNTAVPIDPEDQGNTVDVRTVGQGQVQITPLKDTYNCNEKVTLKATPANDWLFAGWSGDFSSKANPAILTVTGDHEITANFSQGGEVYLPVVMRN